MYLVTDTTGDLNGEYVLKELKNPNRLNRFDVELKAITSLAVHPNIVSLIDSGIYRDPDKPCFVIMKADQNLEKFICDNVISIDELLLIFDKICDGAAYLHTNLIIHRDLKPENILMFKNEPKIADFGLCLIVDITRFTPSSEVIGSRFYMAPEMEDGRQLNVGFEVDVYSLGKILYYLLSGGKIFAREKFNDKDWKLSRSKDDSRLDLFDPVFKKSIVPEQRSRYKDASELQKGFRQARDNFNKHPLTTLFKKFGSMNNAFRGSEDKLQSINENEMCEIFSHAKKHGVVLPQAVFNAAFNSLTTKLAQPFAEALLENEPTLDAHFIAIAAGRIFCLPQVEAAFIIWWLNSEHFNRLALHALSCADNKVLNAIGNWSIFTLQHCNEVLQKLSDNFHNLNSKAKQNFLVASRKSPYEKKEQLLLELSQDTNLDNVSLSAVVAGLCACASQTAIARVIELADRQDMDEKLTAIGGGIILGSSRDTALQLSKLSYKNPVLKVLLDTLDEVESDNKEDKGFIEQDEK